MSETHSASFKFETTPVPVIYLDLVKPRKFRDKKGQEGPPRFGATYLIPKDHPQLAYLKNLVVSVAKAEFPDRDLKSIRLPLEDGDTENAKQWMKGHVLFRTQSGEEYPPRLLVMKGDRIEPIENRELSGVAFWPGVLCGGTMNIVAYTGMGGGVTAYLNEIVSLRWGDKIADRGGDPTKTHESLLKYVGSISTADPTAGMAAAGDDLGY